MEQIDKKLNLNIQPLTKDELSKRIQIHRMRKKKLVEELKEEMRVRIKQRTGEDVVDFVVW